LIELYCGLLITVAHSWDRQTTSK